MLTSNVDAIGSTHVPVLVSSQGKLQAADAPLGLGSCEPTLVRRERIGVDTQYVTFASAELRDPTADRSQFSRSDEGEIPGIEQQHQPAILVVR